jgi:hypothetical protein
MVKASSFLDSVHYQLYLIESAINKRFSILVFVLIATLSLDTMINQVADIIAPQARSFWGIVLFVIIACISIISQFFILQFVKEKSSAVRNKVATIKWMHRAVTMAQYIMTIIFVFTVLQIVLSGYYSTVSLVLVTTVTLAINIVLMGVFTGIFLKWYKSNRNSIVVLLYSLSFATVMIASFAQLAVSMHHFSDKPPSVSPTSHVVFPETKEDTVWRTLGKTYQYSDITSFFLKWAGTALLLYHYSNKIGRIRFWFLLCLPVAYFSTLLIYHFHIYEPHPDMESLFFFMGASLNATSGGILFYISYRLAAKNFRNNSTIRDYLIMTGYGFMVFFSASQATLTATAYPPFGFATISFYGIGSYLILIGLYSSALSVSEDDELRNYIKKSTMQESRFLHSIGSSSLAQREREVMDKVLSKTKEQQRLIAESTGVSTSISEEEIKEYVKNTEEKIERQE